MIEGVTAMKRDPRKAKKVPAPIGRSRTKRVNVAHPTVPGAVEAVDRVVDGTANTLDAMYRRKQLNEPQRRAAERLRGAWETVHGSIGGSMDFDRVRGGGNQGSPPALSYRMAADDLNIAKMKLYALDYRVLDLVVCRGYRLDSAAAIIYRNDPPSRQEKESIGLRFREGLRELAEIWYPTNQGDKDNLRSYHTPDADPKRIAFTSKSGIRHDIDNSAAVHANGRKVFRKG